VVGWTDPEGARPWLGALLLAYYDPVGRLIYAGRVGAGIDHAELERLWRRLQSLATPDMPLDVPPPRARGFGAPLVLSRVHWVWPALVAEVKYPTWTEDNLLRQVVYEGLSEDKPAEEVRRSVPHPNPVASTACPLARNAHDPCDKRQPPLVTGHRPLTLPPPAAAARRRRLVLLFSCFSSCEAVVRQAFPFDGDPGTAG
jgi:hypothetical protein